MSKNILVTGACGGMGRAVCERLTQEGYSVWGLDIRTPDKAEWHFVSADLTDSESVAHAAQQVHREAKSLNAIIHLAGLYDLDSLIEISEERFRRIWEINLFAAYRVNKAFVPMLEKGSRIVLTTSELAPLDPLPFTGLYAVTKSALDKYAYSLRMELQTLGHRVIVLRPGAVKTDLLGTSTRALDAFCENTELYKCNAARFRSIVNRVEARCIPPEKIADKIFRILSARHPKHIYSVNRNPLLLLMHFMPARMQTHLIGWILKA